LGKLVFVQHQFALEKVMGFLEPQEIIKIAPTNRATNRVSKMPKLFPTLTVQVVANPIRTSFCWDRTKKWYDLGKLVKNGDRRKMICDLVSHVFLRSNITSFPDENFPNIKSITISRHDVSFPKYVQDQVVRMAISHDDADGVDDVGALNSKQTIFKNLKHLMLSMDTETGNRDWSVFPNLETIVMDCDSGHLTRNTVPYSSLPKKLKTLIIQVELFEERLGQRLKVPPLSEDAKLDCVRYCLWRFQNHKVAFIDSPDAPFTPQLDQAYPSSKINKTNDVILDKTILQFHNKEYNMPAITDFFTVDFDKLENVAPTSKKAVATLPKSSEPQPWCIIPRSSLVRSITT